MNRTSKVSLFLISTFILITSFAYAADAKAKDNVIDVGKKVKMNFTMKSNGTVLETTEGKAPFEFTFGEHPMILGVQNALKGLKAGDKKSLTLTPENAFGQINPKAVMEFPKTQFPKADIKPGMVFNAKGKEGMPLRGIVKEVKKDTIILDFNHPLAGKELQVDFEVIEVI